MSSLYQTSSALEMQLTKSTQCALGKGGGGAASKQCKDDFNKMYHITRTPGAASGAQLDFDAELESVLKKQLIHAYDDDDDHGDIYNDYTLVIFPIHRKKYDIYGLGLKVKFKIFGDGAKMSKLKSFITIIIIFCR